MSFIVSDKTHSYITPHMLWITGTMILCWIMWIMQSHILFLNTSAKEVMFYSVCVCLSVSKISQKVDGFWWIFEGVRCVTSKNWLDFGGDPAHATSGSGLSCFGGGLCECSWCHIVVTFKAYITFLMNRLTAEYQKAGVIVYVCLLLSPEQVQRRSRAEDRRDVPGASSSQAGRARCWRGRCRAVHVPAEQQRRARVGDGHAECGQ